MKYTNSNQWYQEYGKEVMDKNEFSEFKKYLNDRSQDGSHTLDEWENLYDDFLKDSKKSIKEAKNGYYIYTKPDNKYVFCDKTRYTSSKGFYLLEDYMIDAIHIFETEKEAQEFIDKYAESFMVDEDDIIIAEYPSTKHGFFESKESIKESKNMTFSFKESELFVDIKHIIDGEKINLHKKISTDFVYNLNEFKDICDELCKTENLYYIVYENKTSFKGDYNLVFFDIDDIDMRRNGEISFNVISDYNKEVIKFFNE